MVRIRRIAMDDPLYPEAVALREQTLLRPIGMDIAGYRLHCPGVEERAEHFIAILDHPTGPKVIGCAGLLVEEGAGGEPARGKLVQMAVDPQRQGEGVGRRLLAAVEARAIGELELASLYCHAQITAVGFYERLGWRKDSDEFEEVGIPHFIMTMAGSPKPAAGEPAGPEEFATQ